MFLLPGGMGLRVGSRGRVGVGSGIGAAHCRRLELGTGKVTLGDGGLRVNGRCLNHGPRSGVCFTRKAVC